MPAGFACGFFNSAALPFRIFSDLRHERGQRMVWPARRTIDAPSIAAPFCRPDDQAQRTMIVKAFQDYYPDDVSHCYGCGRMNSHGLQIKSYWLGDESVCRFQPKPYHTAIPGYVYGGLVASLIDCHATGTAAAAKYREEGRDMGSEPPIRFVTASLHVDYLAPTPIDAVLEVRGVVKEIKGRKVTLDLTVSAGGRVCARGEVVAVQMPPDWMAKFKAKDSRGQGVERKTT
jgi:acyl-coenzyme A thioesterase PaaI-like protein